MDQPWWITILVSLIVAFAGSGGFWAFIQSRYGFKDLQSQMLVGLGHDRIVYLGLKYIERGWITHDEFENLNDYLYAPYKKLGGNGSAERVMEAVKKLPIHHNGYKEEKKSN